MCIRDRELPHHRRGGVGARPSRDQQNPHGRQPGQTVDHPHPRHGLPLERIVMDPTTGALGYGMEYGYSVMERLRLAALQGDGMTQQPMIVTPGEEAWRT